MLQNRYSTTESKHLESAVTTRKEFTKLLGPVCDFHLMETEHWGQVDLTSTCTGRGPVTSGSQEAWFHSSLPQSNSKSPPACHIPLVLLCTNAESVWSLFQLTDKEKMIPLKYKIIFIPHKWRCPITPSLIESMGLTTSGKAEYPTRTKSLLSLECQTKFLKCTAR